MEIVRLYTESQERPLGICQGRPAFSWNAETDACGWTQKSYRITVAESEKDVCAEERLLWDSGEICSSQMTGVRYEGAPLKPDTWYCWRVCVAGEDGSRGEAGSCFHTALFTAEEWHGEWIGEQKDHVLSYFP